MFPLNQEILQPAMFDDKRSTSHPTAAKVTTGRDLVPGVPARMEIGKANSFSWGVPHRKTHPWGKQKDTGSPTLMSSIE